MKCFLTFVFALLCTTTTFAGEVAQNVFQIPVFPGTQTITSSHLLESLQLPFLRSTRIYKTQDESALDSAQVVQFYRAALIAKGWSDGVFSGIQKSNFLGLQTQVFENLPNGARIQAAGTFQLWVAPKDGMITVFQEQWRISSLDQESREQVAAIIKCLKGSEDENRYRKGELEDRSWGEHYQNEYLIERIFLILADEKIKRDWHLDPRGLIHISILTYRDAKLAAAEMKRQKDENLISRNDAILTKGKSVVIFENRIGDQKEKVDVLVRQIQALKP